MVETTINISGSVYKLKYTNEACRRIDKELDYSMLHIVEKTNQRGVMAALSMDDIATVLWGGMLHKAPALQVQAVSEMIPMRPIDKYSTIAEKVFTIITEIYGLQEEAKPELEEGNGKADRGTGTGGESKK